MYHVISTDFDQPPERALHEVEPRRRDQLARRAARRAVELEARAEQPLCRRVRDDDGGGHETGGGGSDDDDEGTDARGENGARSKRRLPRLRCVCACVCST